MNKENKYPEIAQQSDRAYVSLACRCDNMRMDNQECQ